MVTYLLKHPSYLVFGFIIYILIISYTYSSHALPKGDEVHYLVTSSSIVKDLDIKLENNYQNHEYPAEYKTIDKHTIVGTDGHEYLYHGLGLYPFLISPGYAVFERFGAVLINSILAVLLLIQIYKLIVENTQNTKIATAVTAIFMFTLPIAQYSFLIFPEIVGAFLILYSFRRLMTNNQPNLLTVLAIGILPWIHVRLLPPAMFLMLIWGYRVFKAKFKKGYFYLFFSCFVICLYFLFLNFIYGSFNPTKPYQMLNIPTGSGNILFNWLNMLIDRQYGLLVYSPFFIFIIPGFITWFTQKPKQVLILWGLMFSYLLPVSSYYDWNGGYSPPSRYLVPIIALTAPAIALFLMYNKNRLLRILLYLFIIWSFAAFLINLILSPNYGFVYYDGVSNFLWFIYQNTGVNFHKLFPAYYPQLTYGILHYLWIILIFVFSIILVKVYKKDQ